jgi:hypothetical protein
MWRVGKLRRARGKMGGLALAGKVGRRARCVAAVAAMALVILSLLAALLLLAGCGTQTKKPETVTRTFTAAHFRFSLTYPSSLRVDYQEEGGTNNDWFNVQLQDRPADDGEDSTKAITVACGIAPTEKAIDELSSKDRNDLRQWAVSGAANNNWVWTYTSRFRLSRLGPYRALLASYEFGEEGDERKYSGKQYILTDDHGRFFALDLSTHQGMVHQLKALEQAAATFRILPLPGDSSPAGASQ